MDISDVEARKALLERKLTEHVRDFVGGPVPISLNSHSMRPRRRTAQSIPFTFIRPLK